MRLQVERRPVEISHPMEQRSFSVSLDPHMMDILSGLYSDIPWAIVREYGTNMLDGYARLPKDQPIRPPRIHLPNALEPYIEFMDFGCGMSFDTVWNVFTTYGASTKQEDDVEVGGFGLGAKAAFCYQNGDQWIVESRFQGEKMVFNAHKNEEGVPTLVHISTTPTDEPNGVTVRIPVARRDIEAFREAVERFAPYFTLPLEVTGNGDYRAPDLRYLFRGESWGIRKGGSQVRLIMGNVPYPVDLNALRSHFQFPDLGSLSVDFYVPVGEVNVVPSREALKYTEKTLKRLERAVEECLEEVVDSAQKAVASAPTFWAALQLVHGPLGVSGLRSRMRNLTWNGEDLDVLRGVEFSMQDLRADYPDLSLDTYQLSYGKAAVMRESVTGKTSLSPAMENLKVVLDDLDRGATRRVRAYMRDQYVTDGYRGRKSCKSNAITYVFKGAALDTETLSERLGGVEVVLLSSLPVPEAAREARGKAKLKTLTYSRFYDTEVNLEEGGYFVRLNRNDPVDFLGSSSTLASFVEHAQELGMLESDARIYGIPRSRSNLEKMEEWIDLVEELRPNVERMLEKHAQELADNSALVAIEEDKLAQFLRGVDLSELVPGSVAHEAALVFQNASGVSETMKSLAIVARALNLVPTRKEPRVDFGAYLRKVKEQYPMVKLALAFEPNRYNRVFETYHSTVVEYLCQVDQVHADAYLVA